jgi:hypothetical protein
MPATLGNLGITFNDGTTQTTAAITASTAEAETGTDNTKFITPLRLREGVNATGTAPIFAARAWVNFDGTGTVAIRASGNVSGITDNGTGDYTVNFTTAMPDANYITSAEEANFTTNNNTGKFNVAGSATQGVPLLKTTTQVRMVHLGASATRIDFQQLYLAIFR